MKNIKIERVYFREPTHIRTKNETRPERVVSCERYTLKMESTGWLLVISPCGRHTLIPAYNITSIVEVKDEPSQ